MVAPPCKRPALAVAPPGGGMRFRAKLLGSTLLLGALCVTLSFWSRCTDGNGQDQNFYRDLPTGLSVGGPAARSAHVHLNELQNVDRNQEEEEEDDDEDHRGPYRAIPCNINGGDEEVDCRRRGSDVYVPFSFIARYFEVYGEISHQDGQDVFEWHHSFARIYKPEGRYRPDGVFMSFEHYNVEVRDRVKCITGMEGVPISTQWGPQGYHYPIQIAQYGLSHYSKYLKDKVQRRVTLIEDAEDGSTSRWSVQDSRSNVHNVVDPRTDSRVIQFSTSASLSNTGVGLPVEETKTGFFLSLDVRFSTNGSITVVVETKGKERQLMYLHYVCSNTFIHARGNEIFHGLGEDRGHWGTVTRDLSIDVQKGLLYQNIKRKSVKSMMSRVVSINLRGRGAVDNVTLANSAHLAQFYSAANWLVLNQDERGGWPIAVTRSLASGRLELPPGWYSAMAQGQAMSLLVRAHNRTGNPKYLAAAARATRLFNVPSEKGGVLAYFAGKYTWYEEYPTTPSSFVLNGFIYALLGLYDLAVVAPPEAAAEAHRLYMAGLSSLKAMLPLFDTGSGSIYDLRHFTLGTAPNLARWDYHATHVNQLLLLATIEPAPIFGTTAQRWITYMNGKRAPHN